MKGYYTVRLVAEDFPVSERMALEERFVAALEAHLGGHDMATALLLDASVHRERLLQVQTACAVAEAAVWGPNAPKERRFELRTFSALDL